MISSWKDIRLEDFEKEFLSAFWDFKLKNNVIELRCPLVNNYGSYGGIFLGSVSDLDIKVFDKLVIDLPGLEEFRKVKDDMIDSIKGENDNIINKQMKIHRVYNSVMKEIVDKFSLFMLTIYSTDSPANLYPLNNDDGDKKFVSDIFSYTLPKTTLSKANRSVLFTFQGNKKCTGFSYLENYFGEDKPELFVSYRVWNKDSFNNFAISLDHKSHDHSKRAIEYMEESSRIYGGKTKYLILD